MTAITVSAHDVSIDLNGFSIIGPTVCTGTGSTLSCTVSGFGAGISSPAHNLSVRNGTIRGAGGDGIVVGLGSGQIAQVDRVRVIHSARSGITIV